METVQLLHTSTGFKTEVLGGQSFLIWCIFSQQGYPIIHIVFRHVCHKMDSYWWWYDWDDNRVLLGTLTGACKTLNDQFRTRLPIHKRLLELLILKLKDCTTVNPTWNKCTKCFSWLPTTEWLDLVSWQWVITQWKPKTCISLKNKKKILFILYSSKTHGKNKKPQKIKIAASQDAHMGHQRKQFFCPFLEPREYLAIRGNFKTDQDPFFVQSDHSPVLPHQVRAVLRKLLSSINLNAQAYNLHSFCVGRMTDMYQYGYSIEQIRIAGHWRSNAVYNYICSNTYKPVIHIFSGYVRGLEKIWIIGDEFSNHTFDQHYQDHKARLNYVESDSYAFKNYEVREFTSNKYDSLIGSTICRIRNSFVRALNKHSSLPKLVVVVVDDDITKNLTWEDWHLFDQLHTVTEWLVLELERALASYKDIIPSKAKKANLPQFLWIAPPTHKYFGKDSNQLRELQGDCLAEVIKT